MIPDILLRLAINRLILRADEKQILEEIVDSEAFFRALNPQLLSRIVGRQVAPMRSGPDDLLRWAERDLRFLRSRGCQVLCMHDRRYPAALREIFDPPYLLYVRGALPNDDPSWVAIVGTRDPSAGAVIAARDLGRDLAGAGLAVVSGLARGIDAAAHAGALEAGYTAAVLASGVDVVTPSAHRQLAAAILDRGGCLMSEYAPGLVPMKYHFPARNRIISGLARGVVVVEAPARSGALITADYALDQGRDLFVHRDGLWAPRGAGTAELAADGALIVSTGGDVLREWGISPPPPGAGGNEPVISQPGTVDDAARARVESVRRALADGVAP